MATHLACLRGSHHARPPSRAVQDISMVAHQKYLEAPHLGYAPRRG